MNIFERQLYLAGLHTVTESKDFNPKSIIGTTFSYNNTQYKIVDVTKQSWAGENVYVFSIDKNFQGHPYGNVMFARKLSRLVNANLEWTENGMQTANSMSFSVSPYQEQKSQDSEEEISHNLSMARKIFLEHGFEIIHSGEQYITAKKFRGGRFRISYTAETNDSLQQYTLDKWNGSYWTSIVKFENAIDLFNNMISGYSSKYFKKPKSPK